MKEQVVCEFSNQYWKCMLSNIMKILRENVFIGFGDLAPIRITSIKISEKLCLIWVISKKYDLIQMAKWFESRSKIYEKPICVIQVTRCVIWVMKHVIQIKLAVANHKNFVFHYSNQVQTVIWIKGAMIRVKYK